MGKLFSLKIVEKREGLKFFQTKFGKRLIMIWAIIVALLILGKLNNMRRPGTIVGDLTVNSSPSPIIKREISSPPQLNAREKTMIDGSVIRLEQQGIGLPVKVLKNNVQLWEEMISFKCSSIYGIDDYFYDSTNNLLVTIEKLEDWQQIVRSYTLKNNTVFAQDIYEEKNTNSPIINFLKYYPKENALVFKWEWSDAGATVGEIIISRNTDLEKIEFCTGGCTGRKLSGYVGFDGQSLLFVNYIASSNIFDFRKNRISNIYSLDPISRKQKILVDGKKLPSDAYGAELYVLEDENNEVIEKDLNLLIIYTDLSGNWEYNLKTNSLAKTDKQLN